MPESPIDLSIGHNNVILACHITGSYDVNRNNMLPADDYSLVREWAESVAKLGLKGIVFHNNFSDETCRLYQNKHVSFIKVQHNTAFNPNVYRYFIYQEFLNKYAHNIENVFFTDVSDVIVVINPFLEPLFTENNNTLFCGDEPEILENNWMKNHGSHLRNKISDYARFEEQFCQYTLLNCGIIGGNIKIMKPFTEQLWEIHNLHNHDNRTAYTGDMGAFNYLVRTRFNAQLRHGQPVNTIFKAYQNDRADCWFRHK